MRRSPLPDFFIGVLAAVVGMTLTRDRRRFQSCFPKPSLIPP
jgi:predicted nucleic acid-binding protein